MRPSSSTLRAALAGAGAAFALAGCLAAPTGLPPGAIDAGDAAIDTPIDTPVDGMGGVWPPPGVIVRAVAGGTVDGDANQDLAAVSLGATPGVYLLRGGVDLDGTVDSYSDFVALPDLQAPVAVTITQSRIVVVGGGPGGHVAVLDSALTPLVQQDLTADATIPTTASISVRPSAFGAGGSAMFALPGRIGFVEDLASAAPAVRYVVSTTHPAIDDAAVLADSWLAGGPQLLVADPDQVHHAPTPTGQPPMFSFTELRTGPVWAAQTTGDVNADGAPDVIGFDANGTGAALVCVHPGATSAMATPTCLATTIMAPAPMQLVFEDVGGMAAARDLVLVHDHPANDNTELFFAANLALSSGMVTSSLVGNAPTVLTSFPEAVAAALDADAAMMSEVYVVARDGRVRCFIITAAQLMACP